MAAEPLDITVTRLAWTDRLLDAVETPKGRLSITLGLGSGLARRAGDPPGVVWAIGDRGPNIKVAAAVADHGLAQLAGLAGLAGLEGAKIMPRPAIGPTLAQLRVEADKVVCLQVLPLRDATGAAFDGLPGPGGDLAAMESAFDLSGAALAPSLSGADTEGVVALADGTFRVADEYGPSILMVSADGLVLARWVPKGEGAALAGAAYRVDEVLPALSARRRLNRGFEAIALSPDETRLHVILQSPLAPEDEVAAEGRGRARLWTLDARTGAPLAEHFYPFDAPETFRRDAAAGPVGSEDLKISEAVSLGGDQLLVLERISRTSKLYRVTLDAPVLTKTLVLSTDDWPQIDADLEGLALLSDRDLLLSTDNDFGVEGRETAFFRVSFTAPLADSGPMAGGTGTPW